MRHTSSYLARQRLNGALALGGLLLSCTGIITDNSRSPSAAPVETQPIDDGSPAYATSHLRRLSQFEYAQAVGDLLGTIHPETVTLYPRDPRTPFDNDSTDQTPSEALVTSAELLATETADAVAQDASRRSKVLGCTPSGNADGTCMRSFIRGFGRRALRHPMTEADIERYATTALAVSSEQNDFYAGVSVVLSALLQHPHFLYRIEVGQPVEGEPGVVRLTGHELASRLSFFIWGSMPDDALLDAAERGELDTPEGVRSHAERMLADARAIDQTSRVHAMWLEYEVLSHEPGLATALRNESTALVRKVLMEDNRPWHDLFRANGTYIADTLATHYGLPLPGSSTPAYVDYGASGRRGILSHGSFLSHGGQNGDSTPIHRGLAVRRGLLCQNIDLPAGFMPPPLSTPTEGQCRKDILAPHTSGGCAGCHQLMDPIGFGLEGFDSAGRVQTTEPNRPACTISGQGELDGTRFQSVGGLSELLVRDGRMAACFESQLYRFALGRSRLDATDQRILNRTQASLGGNEFTYRSLVIATVTQPSFFHRRLP